MKYTNKEKMKRICAIKELRENRDISQQELANRININRSILSHIETGKILPTFEMLLRIARELDCLVSDLYKNNELQRIKNQ